MGVFPATIASIWFGDISSHIRSRSGQFGKLMSRNADHDEIPAAKDYFKAQGQAESWPNFFLRLLKVGNRMEWGWDDC